jgi:2-(1,2-epoxy-1,2-dihydrophenyl)acetyl-CoA isomerase
MADLEETREGAVVTLTLNRPERLNALSEEMTRLLMQAIGRLGGDAEVGAILLTGAGRGFSSGGDVRGMSSRNELPFEQRLELLRSRMHLPLLLKQCPKPVVAAINGPTFGAGLGLALACDIRIAAASAKFGTAFVKIGYSGDYGGSYSLTRLVGPAKARELYLTGDSFDAQQALAWGMLTRVVPDESLAAEAMAFAQRLAAGPRIAHGYIKRNLLAAETEPMAAVLEMEAVHQVRTAQTEDHREAVRAFAEKRPPVFRGR